MKLISDYDCTIEYHLSQANVVADVLSRKSYRQLASLRAIHISLLFSLRETGIAVTGDAQGALLEHFQIRPILVDLVWEAQEHDHQYVNLREQVQSGLRRDLRIWRDGALMMGNRFVPTNNEVVKKDILDEAHISVYAMHPGSTKLYHITC
ncbi:uncharacterized protein [Pyrus communis]|uniref:uncharacterized protein n=1 Tax=Pyrus communis TaxID=23211 RepID=UPI0035BF75E3